MLRKGHPATTCQPPPGLTERRVSGPAGLPHCSRVRSTARRSGTRDPERVSSSRPAGGQGHPATTCKPPPGLTGGDPQARRALHLVARSVLRSMSGGRGRSRARPIRPARRGPKAARPRSASPAGAEHLPSQDPECRAYCGPIRPIVEWVWLTYPPVARSFRDPAAVTAGSKTGRGYATSHDPCQRPRAPPDNLNRRHRTTW